MTSRAIFTAALFAAWIAPDCTESAVANGDTRTVAFTNQHTSETGSFTYMVNGVYDQAVLDKLNWFMRDWRRDEPTKMDPHLFDIIWEVYRESGSQQPVDVLSAYRSPETNAMLRRRSSQVAEHSQHMAGRAIDAHFLDVGTARIRDVAMRMQEGGVGFYPTGITPWVHIDSGSVRYWPRMSRSALARLFPDGKTVFIPADGQPMPGYELAKAEIEARGGEIQTASSGGGLFAWLFGSRGGGADDAEEASGQEAVMTASSGRGGRASAGPGPESEPTSAAQIVEAGPAAVATAKKHLPIGPTYASAGAAPMPSPMPAKSVETLPAASPPAVPAFPEPLQKTEVVAALEQTNVATDAPLADGAPAVKLHGPIAALYLAPLPPRRPSDLVFQLASLGSAPLPPMRPSSLNEVADPVLPPSRPIALEATASIATMPSERSLSASTALVGATAVPGTGMSGLLDLPKIITQGNSSGPIGPFQTLALADVTPLGSVDSSELLEKAAELWATLPPAPVSSADSDVETRPAPQKAGFVKRLTQLVGSLFYARSGIWRASELRGTEE